jgi:hypothetical protein
VNDTQKNKTKKPEEGRPNLKKKKQKKKTEEPDRRPNSIGHLVTRWILLRAKK